MVIKAWGPLFILFVLFGASLFVLSVEHPKPYNRSHPTVAPYKNSQTGKFPTAHGANQNDKKGEQKSSWIEGLFDKPTDTWLVIFNGLLVLFTGLLYKATSGLFKETAELRRIADEQRGDFLRSVTATEISANAAKKSADALPAIERAYVFVVPKIRPVLLAEGRFGVQYYFVNHGKTPAVIDGIEMHFSPLAGPPDNTSFLANIPQANGSVIGAGERWPPSQDGIVNPSVETASITEEAIKSDWFHGTIAYSDVFGRARHTRFRWRFEFSGETYVFSPDGSAPYNERT